MTTRSAWLSLAVLLIVSLAVMAGCGDETVTAEQATPWPADTSAPAEASPPVLVDDPDALIDEVKALAAKTSARFNEMNPLFVKVDAYDPTAANAADAVPVLEEIEAGATELKGYQESIAALLDHMSQLNVSTELKKYAGQQAEIARLYAAWYAQIAVRVAAQKRAYAEAGDVSRADLDELERALRESADEETRLYFAFMERLAASEEYFVAAGLPRRYGIVNYPEG